MVTTLRDVALESPKRDERTARSALNWIRGILLDEMRVAAADADDIAAEFYIRLPDVVSRYRDVGRSLEAFCASHLRYFALSWLRARRLRMTQELPLPGSHSLLVERPTETVDETSWSWDDHPLPPPVTTRRGDADRRALLFLICKTAPLLSAEQIEIAARHAHVSEDWLHGIVTWAVDRTTERQARHDHYSERRDMHFSRKYRAERLLKELPAECGASTRERLERSLAYHRRQHEAFIVRARRSAATLTNREVALVLGVAKGTVDSALANLAARFRPTSGGQREVV